MLIHGIIKREPGVKTELIDGIKDWTFWSARMSYPESFRIVLVVNSRHINDLIDMKLMKFLSHHVSYLFTQLTISVALQKPFNLIRFNVLNLSLPPKQPGFY